MNSKLLIIIALSVIALVGSVAIIILSQYDTNLKEEINRLEQEQNRFPARTSFTGGNMEFLEEWCTNNKGFWTDRESIKRGECDFESRTQYHLASAILDELQQPNITGKPAQEICRFLALECPQRASFDGWYQISTGRTLVNYEYKGVVYGFDVSDEDKITFTIGDSQESFNLSENTTLVDEFSIRVKIGYDYYTLGDKIAISGTVRDNHHILSETKFEYPVTIQIITNGELVEVAQLDIREDGQFQYIINTAGTIWKPGEYEIRVTYDAYQATTTFDMDKESRNLLEK